MRLDSSPARKLPMPSPSPGRQPETRGEERTGYPRRVKKRRKVFSMRLGLDMTFLFLVIILLIIGLIMMFSASYPSAYAYRNNSFAFLIKQAGFAAAGIVIMMVLSYFDYHHFHKLAYPVLAIALLSLVVVLIMPGMPGSGGVKRWIGIGDISIQASEIAKFAAVLFLAHFNSKHFKKMDTFKYGVLPSIILVGVISALLILEPHYSGIVIIALLIVSMMFISGVKLRYFIIALALVVTAVIVLAATGMLSYAMTRLQGWGQALHPETDELYQLTYQTRNSLYAIGSGGFWGLGLGQSRQKFLYIPEAQNDFVFAVVCEELGFIGAAIILCIFALLVWRGITISMRARDKFGALLGMGLSIQIGLQVILNIMVITDWLPNTGISLPFFSYGGSSLITLLAQMGIILSISRTSNLERA